MLNACLLTFWWRTCRAFHGTTCPVGRGHPLTSWRKLFLRRVFRFVSKCMIRVGKQSNLEGNRHFTWGGWFGEATLQRPRPPGSHGGVGRGVSDGAVCKVLAVGGGRHFSFEGLGSDGRGCAKDWLEAQVRLRVPGGICLAYVPAGWASPRVWEWEGSDPTVEGPHLAVGLWTEEQSEGQRWLTKRRKGPGIGCSLEERGPLEGGSTIPGEVNFQGVAWNRHLIEHEHIPFT